jgi:DNA-binding SARP family transcriptional activator/TolB-like protein
VEPGVEAVVESRVESVCRARAAHPMTAGAKLGLRVRLLGPMAVERDGTEVALPTSRKVRALIAYLALSPAAVPRDRLCELLWDLPNDPRGELRWCLSKARGVLGDARIVSDGDGVRLDAVGCDIDALELHHAAQDGLAMLPVDRLRALAAGIGGDFLQGLEIERSAPFSAWLIGQRRRFRAAHAALLEHLAAALPAASDEALGCLEQWLQIAPFDRRAHERLLDALARRGQLREGDEHVAAAMRRFEAESQDAAPIALAWRAAKSRHRGLAAPLLRDDPLVQPALSDPAPTRRASIAVMPFFDAGRDSALRGGLADGLVHDVITRLAKLRSAFVIAQGTVFALDERSVGAEDAARRLDVDYVASGSVRRDRGHVQISAKLTETRGARIVWADEYHARLGHAFDALDEVVDRIVAAISTQVELAERNRAVLKPAQSLDAWEAYHRGLWHMYRFHRDDNERARGFFERALQLDPTFARPYAGLSFTHFQNAFLGWGERAHEIEHAYRSAAQGLMADEHDPSVHWALGRALWLRGRTDDALGELDASVELSPNFALGHYTLAFVHAQSGDPQAAIRSSDHSRDLSPFDPLLFAMLATRAIALIRLGRHDEAADWAVRAIARPNAHVHVLAIAAHCLALADRLDDARTVTASIRAQVPGYRVDDFLSAFRFGDDGRALIRRGAATIGLA